MDEILKFLKSGRFVRMELQIEVARLKELESRLGSLKGIAYSDEIHGSGKQDDSSLVNAIYKIDLQKKKVASKIEELNNYEEEVFKLIDTIDDPVAKIIFKYRYILGETWENISEKTGYSDRHCRRSNAILLKKFKNAGNVLLCPGQCVI